MADDTTRTTADLERLLADYGAAYRFPTTPDIAAAVEARLVPNGRSGNVAERSSLGLRADSPRRMPASRDDRSLGLIAVASRPSRSRQLLELVAGLIIFTVVASLLTLAFRGLTPGSESDAPGSAFVPDDRYALYVTGGPQDQRELLPLDPWTLADSRNLPQANSGDFGGELSADGTTHVRIEYGAESSDGENLPAEDVTVIVSDGLTGAERARFHPPAHIVGLHLSTDGSRLAVQHRRGYGETVPPTWYLLDTSDGSLIGTVSWERNDLPGNRVLINSDATRLYKASWQTVGAFGPYHPELGSLTITSYDLTTGEELVRREFTDIPAGGWALDPEAGADSDIASYEPAVELSPDGERIVVAHADAELVTLIDTDDLQVDRVISLSGSASWIQRFLAWSRISPQDTAAKGAEFTERRSVAFSPDERYLYLWGIASEPDGGQIAYSGIGLTVVDLDRGELAASVLDDKRIEWIKPAPDGKSLYVAWFRSDERPLTSGAVLVLQRLDAATLEVQAEREFVGYRRIVIDPTQDVEPDEPATRSAIGLPQITFNSDTNSYDLLPVDPTTLEPVPGFEPIGLSRHQTHALSPDGRTMAVVEWRGGADYSGGKLSIVNLVDWTVRTTGVEVDGQTGALQFSSDGRSLYWTLPTSTHFASMISRPMAYELYRYDMATGSHETVAAFPEPFVPQEMRIYRVDSRLAILGRVTELDNVTYSPAQVVVVDLENDQIVADVELTGVSFWRYDALDDASTTGMGYRPGLTWDLTREMLYVVHADEERITVVDLADGVVKVQSDILKPRSQFDRFVDWLMPSAVAKSTPWTIRLATLSEDGDRLYFAGTHEEFTQIDDGEIVHADSTNLVIVDTERIEEIDRLDLGTIAWMQVTPDGRQLLVQSAESATYSTGRRLTKLDMETGEVVDQLDLPDLGRSSWPMIVGPQALLRMTTSGVGDASRTEEIRIDLETFTIVSRSVVDVSEVVSYLVPE